MENLKTLPQIKRINALIIWSVTLLVAALCLVYCSDIDVEIQKYFFDFESKTWLVDKDEPVRKFIFYKLPKIFFGVVVVSLMMVAIFSFKNCSKNRHRFFLIFLGLVLIPLIAGNIKKFTNVYCPNRLEIYGGDKPYIRIFDSYPQNFYQEKKAQCFPAGHAVTGFALMILFFAFTRKSHRFLGLASGLIAGWTTGFYQIAKGAHFFGDTLVSMLVCFLLAAIIYKVYSQVILSSACPELVEGSKDDSGRALK